MESLKRIEEVHQADGRNLCWVRMDTGEPISLDDHRARIAAIELKPDVPEDVRSYFTTLQNLCLYAWFSYDFYAVVVFLSYTLIEMALKLRFPVAGKDRRTLKPLLEKAIKHNLIREKEFSHIRRIRQRQAQDLRLIRRMEGLRRSNILKTDYREVLLRSLPHLRNALAHPRGHSIYFPHDALFALRFAAEFVNQVFQPRCEAHGRVPSSEK